MNRRPSAWAAAHAPAGTRWGKKALSLLLSLMLCLTLLPTAALAAGETHEHYLCGNSCDGGSHPQTKFAKKIYQQSGTLYIGGEEWTQEKDYSGYTHLYLEDGTYYLDSNIEVEEAIEPSGSVTLCLNGKTITASGSAIYITPNSSLTLTDCTGKGKVTEKSPAGAGVNVSFGTFNMYGGTITGHSIGVSIAGTFNMYGGAITGNGGSGKVNSGVYLGSQGTMTVSGGAKITGNTYNGSTCNVYLPNGKTITVGGKLTGGAGSIGVTTEAVPTAHTPVTIAAGAGGYNLLDDDKNAFAPDDSSNREIKRDGDSMVLAVPHTHNWSYKTTAGGNTITRVCHGSKTDGSDNITSGSVTIDAPGDLTYDGTPKAAVLTNSISDLPNPKITYEVKNGEDDEDWTPLSSEITTPIDAGTYRATIAVSVGSSSLNAFVVYTIKAHEHCVCGAAHKEIGDHKTAQNITWIGVAALSELHAGQQNTPNYYYLTGPVTLSETWKVPNNVVLCLNGQTITANFDGSAITVQAPYDFTLTDCADTPGVVTHGTNSSTGSKYKGRGVEVADQGNANVGAGFNLYGGSISGNTLEKDGTAQGGGVYAGWYSVFRMYGGSITGNRAISTVNNPGDTTDAAKGGGVCSLATFALYGGSITGNRVEANSAQGGGAYAADRLTISGAPVITDNIAVKSQQSVKNNYYGSKSAYILKALTDGAEIGVTQEGSFAFATGYHDGAKYTYTPTSEDAAKFSSDDSSYVVKLDGNGLYLTKIQQYTVTAYGLYGSRPGFTPGKTYNGSYAAGDTVNLPIGTREGYTFGGLTCKEIAEKNLTIGSDMGEPIVSFTMPATNVTITVNWAKNSSSGGSGSSGSTTYPVTVTGKTENGSVTISPKNASKGTTVTVTVTPDKGYTLETLTVTDASGNKLTLKDKGDGKYTFTMPAGKVEIKASFMEDNTMLNYFVDVKAGDFFYDAVLWAAKNGITKGINDTEFGPSQSCTRAQIVTFLWRAAGSPVVNYAMSMDDVNEGSYYAEAVRWALSEGITGGVGDGRFDPNATCTREQAVAFLYRAAGSPAVSGGSAFSDVAANAYYADAVAWAEKHEITGGIGGGLFGSGNDCTRGQIVTLLYRAYSE